MSIVHSRFQISDSICGIVDTAENFKGALRLAEIHARHCRNVTIFDPMARRGSFELWDSIGHGLRKRTTSSIRSSSQ